MNEHKEILDGTIYVHNEDGNMQEIHGIKAVDLEEVTESIDKLYTDSELRIAQKEFDLWIDADFSLKTMVRMLGLLRGFRTWFLWRDPLEYFRKKRMKYLEQQINFNSKGD